MLYDNNANDIPRKDEHDDKLDLLLRGGEDEFIANIRIAERLLRQNPNFSTDLTTETSSFKLIFYYQLDQSKIILYY